MVLFDRSWYNRAGVERVMGFCTDEQYQRFLRQCPVFEHQLIEDGIILIKYWFSVSDAEQERRFQSRVDDPLRRWKLSPMDLEARQRWVDYSRAKDAMFLHTDTPESPWYVVEADDKRRARLNCIAHLLSQVPYQPVEREKPRLPKRVKDENYQRPPRDLATYVPDYAATLTGRADRRPGRGSAPARASARHATPDGPGQVAHHGEDPAQDGRGVDHLAPIPMPSTTASATASGVVENGAGVMPSVIRPTTNPGRTIITSTPLPTRESPRPWAKASSPDFDEP